MFFCSVTGKKFTKLGLNGTLDSNTTSIKCFRKRPVTVESTKDRTVNRLMVNS